MPKGMKSYHKNSGGNKAKANKKASDGRVTQYKKAVSDNPKGRTIPMASSFDHKA